MQRNRRFYQPVKGWRSGERTCLSIMQVPSDTVPYVSRVACRFSCVFEGFSPVFLRKNQLLNSNWSQVEEMPLCLLLFTSVIWYLMPVYCRLCRNPTSKQCLYVL